MPHRSEDGLSRPSHSLESRIHVVNEVVAHIDGGSDCILDTLCLEPGLSIREVYMRMRTEEWIPSASLVELNK